MNILSKESKFSLQVMQFILHLYGVVKVSTGVLQLEKLSVAKR